MKTLLRPIAFVLIGCICASLQAESPPITLEHAWTPDQINWGLMQRKGMPENHGMLFHYKTSEPRTFWSFNCYFDLSVAFINKDKVIVDIQDLYAYPEKMDPSRPVNHIQDIVHYKPNDPAILFFAKNAIQSKQHARYVLEMNLGWFKKNHVNPGDKIDWDVTTHTAIIKRMQSL